MANQIQLPIPTDVPMYVSNRDRAYALVLMYDVENWARSYRRNPGSSFDERALAWKILDARRVAVEQYLTELVEADHVLGLLNELLVIEDAAKRVRAFDQKPRQREGIEQILDAVAYMQEGATASDPSADPRHYFVFWSDFWPAVTDDIAASNPSDSENVTA